MMVTCIHVERFFCKLETIYVKQLASHLVDRSISSTIKETVWL